MKYILLLLCLATVAAAEPSTCRDAIARDIETRFNIAKVPMGTVRVKPADESQIGELAELRERGAVTYMEIPRKEGDDTGERTFVVTPTKAALKFRDEKASTADAIGIRMRTCEIVKVASEDDAGSKGEATVEERKVVTGVYRLRPTLAGEELFKCGISDDLRFRAAVTLNPGTGVCTVQAVDWGRLGRTDWETSTVE